MSPCSNLFINHGSCIPSLSCLPFFLQVQKSFLQNEWGYRDGLKYQKGHSKDAQSYMTPSLYFVHKQSLIWDKDIRMVSCSFVQLCCVMTPCFFLFGASSHPYINYIPLHLEEKIFPLVSTIFIGLWQHDIFSHSDVHGYVVTDISRSYYVLPVPEAVYICVVSPTRTQLGSGALWLFHGQYLVKKVQW